MKVHPMLYPSRWNYWLDSDVSTFNFLSGTSVPAVSTLVKSLKSANLWPLLTAVFPFVGTTSLSQGTNLRRRGNDINFLSGTFTSLGWNSQSGTDTRFRSGHLPGPMNSFSYGLYVIENGALASVKDILGPTPNFSGVHFRLPGDLVVQDLFSFNAGRLQTTSTTHNYITGSRGATTSMMLDTTLVFTGVANSVEVDDGTTAYELGRFSTRTHAFLWMGFAMTDAQLLTMSQIVKTFQTSVGR